LYANFWVYFVFVSRSQKYNNCGKNLIDKDLIESYQYCVYIGSKGTSLRVFYSKKRVSFRTLLSKEHKQKIPRHGPKSIGL